MNVEDIRCIALALPEVVEAPHFDFSSFRVRGKIFATVPPGDEYLHVFVDEAERDRMVSADPKHYEKLWWGKKVVGLRIAVAAANADDVEDLLTAAWKRKAPTKLVRLLEGEQ